MQIDIGDTKGVTMKLTLDGRVTIPSTFRKALGLELDEEVEIFLVKEGIFIKKGEKKNGE